MGSSGMRSDQSPYKERVMAEILVFLLVIVVWFLLQAYLLPKLGVST